MRRRGEASRKRQHLGGGSKCEWNKVEKSSLQRLLVKNENNFMNFIPKSASQLYSPTHSLYNKYTSTATIIKTFIELLVCV